MARTVNLVSLDNGVGLSADMLLLEQMLVPAGYDVVRVDYRQHEMRPCDVAIFLELINPNLLPYARRTVGIFNLEWLPNEWVPLLPSFTQLWAKSGNAYDALARLRLPVYLTGFLSRDVYDASVPRQLRCLHLRGHSILKNTEEVIETWRRHPDLPPLTIISYDHYQVPDHVQLLGRQPENALRWYMNTCAIHICPSRAEGWGHYITEGMSTGNAVITLDAAPMNENAPDGLAFLIKPSLVSGRHMVHDHYVNPDDLARAVRAAAGAYPGDGELRGGSRRAFVGQRNTDFRNKALDLLDMLL
jgi:hypothetical protein